MSRYLSSKAIVAAFNVLKDASVSSTDLSALRYCLALDAFAKKYGRDCSLKKGSDDKDLYINLVNDVVAIDVEKTIGGPSYIDKFNGEKPKKSLSGQVSSNFITANAVRQSRGKSNEPYPAGKGKDLFNATDEVLQVSSIKYGHISHYLSSVETRVAFAIWVARYEEIAEGSTPAAELRTTLMQRYSKTLVDILLDETDENLTCLKLSDKDLFRDSRPLITWELLFPNEVTEYRFTSLGDLPHNLIYFGAPGTGKSHQVSKLAEKSFAKGNISRVTFYPDYTYSQFVGCYKPCADENDAITYRYVAGPFLDTYLKACTHPDNRYALIVEEINRANPAAVFGDVFQLLDRGADGSSEYAVAVPADMRKCIEDALRGLTGEERDTIDRCFDPDMNFSEFSISMLNDLALPPNMYIWATMNSADQGVFPMDTAFKRRWDFRYIGIDDGEDADINGTPLNKIEVPCGGRTVVWNNLRHAINEFMASDDLKINEDKLLGPFFINPSALTPERFADVFKDKVLLYLYEDAGKTKRTKMFKKELNTYSKICAAFDKDGEGIFGNGFDGHIVFGETEDADDAAAEE